MRVRVDFELEVRIKDARCGAPNLLGYSMNAKVTLSYPFLFLP